MTNIRLQKETKLATVLAYVPYAAVVLLAVGVIFSIGYFKDDISNGFSRFLSQNLGLKVDHIYISGLDNTDPVALRQAIEIKKGQPIFSFSTNEIRSQVESLPWVRLAQVQRILPNTININIFEHKAIATIKFNNERWALNSKGTLIDVVGDKFNHLLELSGTNAKENAASLFSLFTHWTDLLFLVKQAEFVGNRRWNLYLDNGILIMLPEENVRYALKVLQVLNSQQRILHKKEIKVDLRNVQKHIIVDEGTNQV